MILNIELFGQMKFSSTHVNKYITAPYVGQILLSAENT